MKYLKQYKIPFSGLAGGKHDFEFDIDDEFFSFFEYSLVKQVDLKANVSLVKQENMLVVNFLIEGTIKLTCDVCLSLIDTPIRLEERLLVKFSREDWDDETEEVVVLSKQDHELDLVNILYEYINVSVPLFVKCDPSIGQNCDTDMLNRIEKESDFPNDIESSDIDPRWEILKKIKNN